MTDTAAVPEAPPKTTLTVTIDGRAIEANKGELLIAAAERTGTYIPRFCWHPRMREVGMCRMCLVEVDGPRGPALQPSCMLPATEGMVVHTKSDVVKKAQDGVLEFLLINHPLDCPVCDKGGECPLQDQTMAFGPGESRFVEEKRHFEKPINISDLVLLDRERCILCDRCTRFSKEVAGDPLIHFMSRGNHTEVNTFPDDPFASYFSGNVVQICPVGALTATSYRFSSRPWDLDQVESTCTTCAVGCRVVLQSSGDEITRCQGVDSDPVNWGWLCDKGRFDFDTIASPDRVTRPQLRAHRRDPFAGTSWGVAIDEVASRLRAYQPNEIGFIGGARLTNEDQYAWVRTAKSVLRTDNVDAQLGDGLPAEAWLGLPGATIDEACAASVIVLLGADVKEELPVLFLRLRDAAANRHVPIVELSAIGSGLTRSAKASLRPRPGELAVTAQALVNAAAGASISERGVGGVEAEAISGAAKLITDALASGKGNGKVVVVLGRASIAELPDDVLDAAATLHTSDWPVSFLPAMRRANVRGALEIGMAPGLLPGRTTIADGRAWYTGLWGSLPGERGLDTEGMLRAASDGRLKALVLLGADPLTDFPDATLVRAAMERVEFVVAVDTHGNASHAVANVVLPALAYGERSGTTTNLEGRVTTVAAKVSGPGLARPDWMIATELAGALGSDFGFETVEELTVELSEVAPSYRGCTPAALASPANRDGVLLGTTDVTSPSTEEPASPGAAGEAVTIPLAAIAYPALLKWEPGLVAPSAPLPDSYSLRLVATRRLYDKGTLVQASAALAHLHRSPGIGLHPSEADRRGLAEGGRVNVSSSRGSLEFAVRIDESVPRGVAQMDINLGGPDPREFIDLDADAALTMVRLETIGG